MNRKIAFTLIELLFTVSIIAILAAISVPNFLEAQVRSKVARTRSDMSAVSAAVRAWSARHGQPPPSIPESLEELAPLLEPGAPGLDPNEEFERRFPFLRESGYALAVLTTPNAWFARALPSDTFQSSYRPNILEPALPPAPFLYLNLHELCDGDAQTTSPRPGHGYTLLSVGPDYNLSMPNPVLGPYTYYDPSNGTTSKGDIIVMGY